MKSLTASIVTAPLLFVFAGLASGASANGQLQVQATVPPLVEFKIVHEKHRLEITKSDAKKGYKELNNGTIISVTTNIASGYVISVSTHPLSNTVYTYVTVTVDGRSFGTAPGGSVDIQMPATSKTNDTTRLSYRFTLTPGVEPGTYPWPIVVTVYPL